MALALLALGAWGAMAWTAAPARGQGVLDVTFANAKLSVKAAAVSVAEVVGQVERATGVAIAMDPSVQAETARETCVLDLSGVSVEDGLRRILGRRHLVALYGPAGLDEVRVYPDGGGSGGTGEIAGATRRTHERLRGAVKPTVPTPPRDLAADLAAKAEQDARRRESRTDLHVPALDPAGSGPVDVADAARVLEQAGNPRAQAEALETLLDAQGVPLDPVLRFAETTRDPELRGQALEVLAAHGEGNPRVREMLRALAAGDPDEDVRDRAQALLGAASR